MELTRDEEAALNGRDGHALQVAYRVLAATGEASGADRLAPIQWAHLSGVNYNTIGSAGRDFLEEISADARVKVRTTVNPAGYDPDSADRYGLSGEFIEGQESIRRSYKRMGVEPTFSCIPYDISEMPAPGTRVAFAESNAAIYANSVAGLRTGKESAFSALASALTGKSPSYDAGPEEPRTAVRMAVQDPDELAYGMLGYFAGQNAEGSSVRILDWGSPDHRSCKAVCGGMGTSGTCSRFVAGGDGAGCEKIDFGREEMSAVHDELNTADQGDLITLGSPQLGLQEMASLAHMLRGKSFKKRCMVFCPRTVKDQANKAGHCSEIERAGCEILADCCTCLTPLVDKDEVDAVTTNSIKGAYYLKNSTGVGVNLKSLAKIIEEEAS